MNFVPRAWQIWIDTGGTFTDCLAVSPGGETRRAKVLSSSALRGVVSHVLGPTQVGIAQAWNAPADFAAGFTFHRLGEAAAAAAGRAPILVTRFEASASVLELDQPVDLAPGMVFEVVSPGEAPILAARLVTQTGPGQSLPPLHLRLATTRGTNALLTRGGAPTALFVTEGFADLLEIGTQQRPDLFVLDIVKPAPLPRAVVEVGERLAFDGAVLRPLDEATLARDAAGLVARGITTAAVVLLHGYRNPVHETRVAAILRAAGFVHVSCASDLAPFIKLLPRAQTTVVNAYLAAVVESYVARVEAGLSAPPTPQNWGAKSAWDETHGDGPTGPTPPELGGLGGSSLHVMTSAGGLVRPESFRAKDSLLSGPAGGIVGAMHVARASGFSDVIAFDMGGTSTDVARVANGSFPYVWEHAVGGVTLVAPALAIESVAAGGGSVCVSDAHGLRVGPESAGARPGPACYGANGPLTVSDVNLLLGRLDAVRFPIPINVEAARAAANAAADAQNIPVDVLLEGFLDIANEAVADAIRGVSLRRGYDPADHALVAFGGAGGQHACAVAEQLGLRTVLIPLDAGLLSARGLGSALVERFAERQFLRSLANTDVAGEIARLEDEARRAVAAEGVLDTDIVVRRRIVNLRLAGQESALAVEFEENVPLANAFTARYAVVWGDRLAPGRTIEVESLRVVASARPEAELAAPAALDPEHRATPEGTARVRFNGVWAESVATFEHARLAPGAVFAGPALVFEAHGATVVPPGWTGRVDAAQTLVLSAPAQTTTAGAGGKRPDAVQRELFARRFAALAGEMGEMLRRTALSTNVKERLDFSCALLDARGELVATAAHIPVHLGALGLCVRSVRDQLPLRPGDVALTNHPAFGGSHLPDVTLITPVFDRVGEPLGYVASRAHHAEIGGARPGSMPPFARTLIEEGVVLEPMYLVEKGELRLDNVRARLESAPFPSRRVADNLADLRAALAANRRGANALRRLADAHGADTIRRHMDGLQSRAADRLSAALDRLPAGRYAATERLDDGSPLAVTIDIAPSRATIDFAGTAPVHGHNLNATPAIVYSAVLYVLRLFLDEPLPLNEGLLRNVTLRIPPGCLLNPVFDKRDPARCPAVVGGNTETSQRLVDTLLKALNLAAGSQGTMNNVLFGNDTFGYYETVCGGAGATCNAPGAHAVHTHLTNTQITDPEILEARYPVRLERFAIRRGSGGAGYHAGGDGVVRELTFLAPLALSVLTQHRNEGPFGMAGGAPGLPGRQHVVRAQSGVVVELGSVDGCDVLPGDRLILETPGGGGWGA